MISYGHRIDQQVEKKVSFGVERSNVGDHLKRVLPKFEVNWSYPRGVNGRSKFSKNSQCFDFVSSKNEMLGIVWNAFWQSLAPIRAIFEGRRSFEIFTWIRATAIPFCLTIPSWTFLPRRHGSSGIYNLRPRQYDFGAIRRARLQKGVCLECSLNHCATEPWWRDVLHVGALCDGTGCLR